MCVCLTLTFDIVTLTLGLPHRIIYINHMHVLNIIKIQTFIYYLYAKTRFTHDKVFVLDF